MEIVRAKRPVGDRQIHVIDGLFDDDFIALCYAWIDRLPYIRADYDAESAKEYRHFMFGFNNDALAEHPVTRQLDKIVRREISMAYGALGPQLKRAHINLAPYGDHFTAHIDNACGVTAIYFANQEWRDEWHGETMFYADGEAVTAVKPRPGRLALLPADMVHRVGAPSRLFSGARYTIAFKFDTASAPA